MYKKLEKYIRSLENDLSDIPEQRKERLRTIAGFIRDRQEKGTPARLTFICTHNSRRSHLCQVWASALAWYREVHGIESYSGGTEATAFNPRAVKAIERAGFRVEDPGGTNPRYKVTFDAGVEPLTCFSKTFDDPLNPKKNFAAIMTCSEADQNCPFVPGASLRVSIPYVDPKESDGTPHEAQTYDKRCHQIAGEMLFVMSSV